MPETPTSAPAGWYPDPEVAGGRRYWDGSSWTEQRHAPKPPSRIAAEYRRILPSRSARITFWVVGSIAVIVGIGAIAGGSSDSGGSSDAESAKDATSSNTTPSSSTTTAPDSDAASYIEHHGSDANRVQAMVQTVQIGVGELQRSPTTGNVNQLAQLAQSAHDNIDAIRNSFAETDSGPLGDAELDVFSGANDLKNSMGALVAYTGSPNPAALADFTSQYTSAKTEWNRGIRTIWRLARESDPPTV